MRNILKVVLIGLFVLTINKPLFVFALGEIDGIWIGEETISVLGEQYTEITGTIIFQESDTTLYIYDDLFGTVLLVKSGDQWFLPSPMETTYLGYTCIVNEISLIFHGESYLTGTITVTVYAYGEEYVGHASLSHDKQFCQTLSNGVTVSDLSGGEDSLQFFEVDLPPGAINLNVQTWGGSGDCDLYLIYSRPDFYNDWSDDDFNNEEITVTSPDAGKWYIGLEGWESYSGVNLRVTYDSYSCTYSIDPTSEHFSSSGGSGTVSVTTESGCDWTATSNVDWITITSFSGSGGNGSISYLVSPTSSSSYRTGTMTIAGETFIVTQGEQPVSPVYRFWSDQHGSHFFTISEADKDYVETLPEWRYEGIAWYAYATQQSGTLPVYRFWSDQHGSHFFTISEADKDYVETLSEWRYEGIAWYAYQ